MILFRELESQPQDDVSRTWWLDETQQQRTFFEISQGSGTGNLRNGKPEIQAKARRGPEEPRRSSSGNVSLAHLGGFTGHNHPIP